MPTHTPTRPRTPPKTISSRATFKTLGGKGLRGKLSIRKLAQTDGSIDVVAPAGERFGGDKAGFKPFW